MEVGLFHCQYFFACVVLVALKIFELQSGTVDFCSLVFGNLSGIVHWFLKKISFSSSLPDINYQQMKSEHAPESFLIWLNRRHALFREKRLLTALEKLKIFWGPISLRLTSLPRGICKHDSLHSCHSLPQWPRTQSFLSRNRPCKWWILNLQRLWLIARRPAVSWLGQS